MNLLTFGMENRRSASPGKRAVAEAALAFEKFRANQLEKKLEREIAEIKMTREDDDRIFQNILKQAESSEKAER